MIQSGTIILYLGYIDPGSGAMLLQWIIALVVGTGVYFRRLIVQLLKRIFRIRDKDERTDESKKKDEKRDE